MRAAEGGFVQVLDLLIQAGASKESEDPVRKKRKGAGVGYFFYSVHIS